MAEGQQRIILLGAFGTLVLLFALYILLILLRVLWTRWQTYLSQWARQRVDRDRAALGRHRSNNKRTAKKQHHQRRDSDSDSDSRSWSSDESRSE